MTNIFETTKEKVMPEWAKFVNAGDSVQGTYVGKILGQIDGYGNEQIIYQLLKEDGKVVNVGFGLNKKVLHKDMEAVSFGQIVGFKYKGTISIKDKRSGNMVNVKDYALHQDPKIVNETWLRENKDNMPQVITSTEGSGADKLNAFVKDLNSDDGDVPFSSENSLTNEDKLKVIEKLAKDKLGATSSADVKEKVMIATGVAFIPVQYQAIIDKLAAM